MREGRPGREFFVLSTATCASRKGKKIADLAGGDWFGEIALLTKVPRTATITATSDVDGLVITDRRSGGSSRRCRRSRSRCWRASSDRLASDSQQNARS